MTFPSDLHRVSPNILTSLVLRYRIQTPQLLIRSDREAWRTDKTRMAELETCRRPALTFFEHSVQMAKWIKDLAKHNKKCRDQDRMQHHLKGREDQQEVCRLSFCNVSSVSIIEVASHMKREAGIVARTAHQPSDQKVRHPMHEGACFD